MLILGGILLYRSYALYEEEKEFNVLKGQIPDFGYDIKMLSVKLDGEKTTNIPERGRYKVEVECSGTKTTGSWDYNAWNLVLENAENNARCNLNFIANGLTEEEYNKYIEAGVAKRRNTYRGKDISSYHQDGSLYTMISNGTFDDIYVGDYIIDNQNHKWLIADIDNYLYTGAYKPLAKHHVTVIPATILINAKMEVAKDGYYGSNVVTQVLPNYLSTYVIPIFGEHVISYYNYLIDSYDVINERTNGASWYERQIDLMSEANVYGTASWAGATRNGGIGLGVDTRQYAIFRICPQLINYADRASLSYWLKDITSSISFAVNLVGVSQMGNIANESGIRPRFLIG